MTLKQAIQRFDSESPNTTDPLLKIQWLSYIDSLIHKNIILTHEHHFPPSFNGYDVFTPEDTVLLVPDPFSELYIFFLSMKNDILYSDTVRYNNSAALFNSAYREFESYYHKNHTPLRITTSFNA